MRTKFPGYFKLSDKEIKSLWDNAIFTFDANILLNLYRYSDSTRNELFKILEKIKDRVWLTHQSAQEFFDNKLNVINEQEKAYEDAISDLNSIETKFNNPREHPFIDEKLLRKISSLSKDVCEQLNERKEIHKRRITEDDILIRIVSLFENKVGEGYNDEKSKYLYKEGEERFANKIPPGFKDSKKKDGGVKESRKYGDYILWKQTMDKSKASKQDIILITDDRKEDWWMRFKGKTVSPRPELIKEFKDFTSQSFHMYKSDRFLEFAREHFNEKINERTLEEIRELRKHDKKRMLSESIKEKGIIRLENIRDNLRSERVMLEVEMQNLEEIKHRLRKKLQDYNSYPSDIDDSNINKLFVEIRRIDHKLSEISQKLRELEEREIEIRNKYLRTIL